MQKKFATFLNWRGEHFERQAEKNDIGGSVRRAVLRGDDSGADMADVITGYAHYAVATFIIKAIMAAAAWAVYSALGKGRLSSALRLGIAGVVSELIMTVGYFAYDCLLRGQGLAAAASIPNYVIQGGIGIVAAVIIIKALERTPILSAGKAGV